MAKKKIDAEQLSMEENLQSYEIGEIQHAALNADSYIYQANYLIENRPPMTRDEYRLFISILAEIGKDENKFNKTHQIPVTGFAELWNLKKSNAYPQIRSALDGLQSKKFQIEKVLEDGKKDFQSAYFISYVHYRQGEGYCNVRIDEFFKPYLVELSREYTKYLLKHMTQLGGDVLSMRLYELLKQYETIGTRVFTVDEFKERTNLNKKQENGDLLRVTKKAIKNVCENTDIKVDMHTSGRGPRLMLHFSIQNKNKSYESKPKDHRPADEKHASASLKQLGYELENDPEAPSLFISWIKAKPAYQNATTPSAYLKACLDNKDTGNAFIEERRKQLETQRLREEALQEAERIEQEFLKQSERTDREKESTKEEIPQSAGRQASEVAGLTPASVIFEKYLKKN